MGRCVLVHRAAPLASRRWRRGLLLLDVDHCALATGSKRWMVGGDKTVSLALSAPCWGDSFDVELSIMVQITLL